MAVLAVAALLAFRRPGHESSASHRAFIWQTCIAVIGADARATLLGTGVGGFRDAFSAHRPWVGTDRSDVLAIVRDAHCDVLMVACESGVPAALVLLALMAWAIVRPDGMSHPLALGYRAGLCAWVATGLAHGTIDVLAVATPAAAVLGLRLGPASVAAVDSGVRRATYRSSPVAGTATALLAVAWLSTQASARLSDLLVTRAAREASDPWLLVVAVRLYPSREALLALADAAPDARVSTLRRAVRLYPRDAEVFCALSQAVADTDRAEALAHARMATSLDPYNPFYWRWRGGLEESRRVAAACLDIAIPLYERTLEVATARLGAQSPQAEALRTRIAEAREALGK